MSGLLQRLARHVVGPAPLMARARIAPRFASGADAAPAGDFSEQAAPSAAPGWHRPPAPPSALTDTPTLREVAAHTPHRTDASAGRVPRPADAPHGTTAPYRVAAKPAGTLAATATAAVARDARPRPPAPPQASIPFAAAGVEPPSRTRHTPSASGTHARTEHADAHSVPLPLFAAHAGDGQAPLRAEAVADLGRNVLPARARDAEAPDGAPREVHVHIGRIEVTALQDAPVAKPSARGRQPMSLDEYLARRQGERR